MRYQPTNSLETPRFTGVRTFMRLPYVTDPERVDIAILGVPFDTGTSFAAGARFGPEAIRSASVLLRPFHPVLEVNIFDCISVADMGDLPTVPGYIEDTYKRIVDALVPLCKLGVVPLLLGGDHSITLAHLRVVSEVRGPIAFIQFDSHGDTWDSYFGKLYNHGTVFRRAAEEGLVRAEHCCQVGLRGSLYSPSDYQEGRALGYEIITTHEMRQIGLDETVRRIRSRVGDCPVFITFDVDFLDPVYAPGTGTPEIGGFTTYEAQYLIRNLKGLNFVGFDIVETLPDRDPSRVTALAAAGVAYELLTLYATSRK